MTPADRLLAVRWAQDAPSSAGPTERMVLVVLATLCDAGYRAVLSVAEIARRCGAAERTIQRALPQLVASGLVEAHRYVSDLTAYSLLVPWRKDAQVVTNCHPSGGDKLSPRGGVTNCRGGPYKRHIEKKKEKNKEQESIQADPFVGGEVEEGDHAGPSLIVSADPMTLPISIATTGTVIETKRAPVQRKPRAEPTMPPHDWEPPAEWIAEWVSMTGWDERAVRAEVGCCLLWHRERGLSRASWRATVRNWIVKSLTFQARVSARGQQRGGQGPTVLPAAVRTAGTMDALRGAFAALAGAAGGDGGQLSLGDVIDMEGEA